VADHGTSTGWSDTYVGQATFTWTSAGTLLNFAKGYYTFDGSYSTFGVTGSYGFRLYLGSRSRNAAGDFYMIVGTGASTPLTGWTIKNVELDFDNGSAIGDTGMAYCLYSRWWSYKLAIRKPLRPRLPWRGLHYPR
jgi:hypothetical protein